MNRILLFVLIFSLQLPILAQPLKRTSPESVGMSPTLLHNADVTIQASIDAGEIPGAVLAVVRHGRLTDIARFILQRKR